MKTRSWLSSTRPYIAGLVVAAAIIGIFAVARLDITGKRGSGLGPQYDYDLSAAAHIDPNLILFEESGSPMPTGFGTARSIFVDPQGIVYISGDKAIRMFGQNQSVLKTIDLAGEPRCLAVADEGKMYIAMKDHVEIYEGDGKVHAVWGWLGKNAVLTSIAVYRDDVFVADAGNRIVLHYNTAGKLESRIGQKDKQKNTEGFVVPSPYFDLAVGQDGLLRVVNPGMHRIEAYTFAGDLEFQWGKFSTGIEGFCGCCNPVNFAILPNGDFVTCEKGLVRVKVYDSDGKFVGVVAGPQQLTGPGQTTVCRTVADCQAGGFDVAVDKGGKVYVLDTINNIVRTFVRKKPG